MSAALRKEKVQAIQMRKEGASYSQIKEALKVSKSSLSLWLRGMPLSKKRMREVRDRNAVRIERYRETRRRTREARWAEVRKKAAKDIGALSKKELLIAGLFLYWGEGGKTERFTTSLSNTDPAMIRFFIQWLQALDVPREQIRVRMHFYADMDAEAELRYWMKALGLPRSAFQKPYIKASSRSGLTYPQKFTHGTCNILFHNRNVSEYVLQALEHMRLMFAPQ